ncbi:GL19903 [Drosophila persimilis]|uniref:GL19903 n=1 Tax=Drosophila persimilis TaxID=7234 RepID=B4GYE6_DROPE|nr:GL19903 [Drosophila persimilis]
MPLEMLNVQGVWVPHHVVPIVGDGACLFRALSFLIFNTQDQARTVRQQIVHLVTSEWQTFSILSHDSRGDNYRSAAAYSADMSRPYTYGSLCELMAAGIIYNLRFEVYRNGILYTSTGSLDLPVRRLRFRDNLSAGHFDAYVPMARGGRRASAI